MIAGSRETVLARLAELVDRLGPIGTLVMVGHDFDKRGTWQRSMRALATEIMPALRQHASAGGQRVASAG